MAKVVKTVEQLCVENGIDAGQLAGRSGLDEQRVVAIALGRWTPSPQERDCIAAVFGLARDQIVWGHKTPIPAHLWILTRGRSALRPEVERHGMGTSEADSGGNLGA